MKSITFNVPGVPRGKARPRVVDGHAYTPHKTKAYEMAIRDAYTEAALEEPPEARYFGRGTDVGLIVRCYFPVPKQASKAKREAMLEKKIRPQRKPDIDNVLKAVADALNGVAYYDDCQIIMMSGAKFYAADPRINVEIFAIPGMCGENLPAMGGGK